MDAGSDGIWKYTGVGIIDGLLAITGGSIESSTKHWYSDKGPVWA
jgi:hypothetical protein